MTDVDSMYLFPFPGPTIAPHPFELHYNHLANSPLPPPLSVWLPFNKQKQSHIRVHSIWRRSFGTGASHANAVRALKDNEWNALVIGGGHNCLIAAAYLARAGLSVAVLERRRLILGAALNEEVLTPGFKLSRSSYRQSLLCPSIIRELELARQGLKLLKRN